MGKLLKNNGLTIVLLVLFACSLTGQWLTGWHVTNNDLLEHGRPTMTLARYSVSPYFLSAVFENWESEFLQMATYVLLTAVLVQRGSAESKDPDDCPRNEEVMPQDHRASAPYLHRAGRAIYSHSLFLALAALFVLSFSVHWTQSARVAAQAALEHGEIPPTVISYLGDAELWFESFQNWQSEFLSTAVLVVLSIFLRQRGSPESKPVGASNAQTGSEA
jgi:membrane protein implicated in regulation of membrane protease activity